MSDRLVIRVEVEFPDGFQIEDPKRARLIAEMMEVRALDSTGDDGEHASVKSHWEAS